MLMPVVMLLKNGDAVILTKRIGSRSKRAGGARYEVIMPGSIAMLASGIALLMLCGPSCTLRK